MRSHFLGQYTSLLMTDFSYFLCKITCGHKRTAKILIPRWPYLHIQQVWKKLVYGHTFNIIGYVVTNLLNRADCHSPLQRKHYVWTDGFSLFMSLLGFLFDCLE